MSYTSRNAALNILSDVEKGSFLNLAVKRYLPLIKKEEDRRFCAALAYTTIENLIRIDYVIDNFVAKKKLQKVIRNILRLGVCQLMFFEAVPQSAAVNESVKLCHKCGKSQMKGFVNGVLRNISESMGSVEYPKEEENPAQYLSVMFSYPKWICEKFICDFGYEKAYELLSYSEDNSLTCIRIKKGCEVNFENSSAGKYSNNVIYLKNTSAINSLKEYKEGKIIAQGEASVVSVDAMGIKENWNILDVCAAPGGKSLYAAEKCESVAACDVHEHRVRLINANIERMGAKNITVMQRDACEFDESFSEKFDAVLADVPCSALGILYKKPDVKINKTKNDIEEIIKIQRKILDNVKNYVKKGGLLFYSTCTLNKDENFGNIEAFLAENPDFEIDDITPYLPDGLKDKTQKGCLQIIPPRDEIDGFFMARLIRK